MNTKILLPLVACSFLILFFFGLSSQAWNFTDNSTFIAVKYTFGLPLTAVSYTQHSDDAIHQNINYPERGKWSPGLDISPLYLLVDLGILVLLGFAFFVLARLEPGRYILVGLILANTFGLVISYLIANAYPSQPHRLIISLLYLIVLIILLMLIVIFSTRPFKLWKPPAIVLPMAFALPWVALWYRQFLLKNRSTMQETSTVILSPTFDEMVKDPIFVCAIFIALTYLLIALQKLYRYVLKRVKTK